MRARAAAVAFATSAAAAALAAVPAPAPAAAASPAYPTRPVRLVVPFPPGGGADFMGRMVAYALTEKRGYTVVIDNRGGAGGAIGSDLVARATPDGYTLVLANNSTHVLATVLARKAPYDPLRDFTPVSMTSFAPQLLVASNVIAARSVAELLAMARAKPGSLNYGSGGNASQTHLASELMRLNTGIAVSHIPYKGSGPAFTALIAGEVQFMFVSMPPAMPHVQAGRIRALAITGAQRSPLLPQMATLAESGVRGFEIHPWFGVLGPPRLPAAIVKQVNADLVAGIRTDDVKARLATQGGEALGSTPDAFAEVIRQELEQWRGIVDRLGIRSE